MKQSDAKILLVLLAIGLIVASIFLVAKPKNDSIKALQTEISDLQARYDDLCAKEAQKDQCLAENSMSSLRQKLLSMLLILTRKIHLCSLRVLKKHTNSRM